MKSNKSNGEKNQVPKIYAFTYPPYDKQKWTGQYEGVGCLKIGKTNRDVKTRVEEQINSPNMKYKILVNEIAVKDNKEEFFSDKDVHRILKNEGFKALNGEWFECTKDDVLQAIISLRHNTKFVGKTIYDYKLRDEQKEAINKTKAFFEKWNNKSKVPKFLWNAKMRFGKTFAAYKLIKKMNWKNVIILTYKPSISDSWKNEMKHVSFKDWVFKDVVNDKGVSFSSSNDPPQIVFASFQFLTNPKNKTNKKIESLKKIKWDCIIIDEYHWGAWRDLAQQEYPSEKKEIELEYGEVDVEYTGLNANAHLFLSGTPFRAMRNGEFLEDQIFSWSYLDEQKKKIDLSKKNSQNPYAIMPKLTIWSYCLPKDIIDVVENDDGYDLQKFFKTNIEIKDSKALKKNNETNNNKSSSEPYFIYELKVRKWLDLLVGENSKLYEVLKEHNIPFPYYSFNLDISSHSFWILHSIAACKAMEVLLKKHPLFRTYTIINASGSSKKSGKKALIAVKNAIGNGFDSRTITLSCGMLTLGITVPQWGMVLYLRNSRAPEMYFQTIFRCQSPWYLKHEDGSIEIIKKEAHVFDFSSLTPIPLIYDYVSSFVSNMDGVTQDVKNTQMHKLTKDFLDCLPLYCYVDGTMEKIDASELIKRGHQDLTTSMLIRKWQSPYLVDLNIEKLDKILADGDLLEKLKHIKGFRNMVLYMEQLSEMNKQRNLKTNKEKPGKKSNQIIDEDEKQKKKERMKHRNEIKEILYKFLARIPIFLYLTDYREQLLRDIIRNEEKELFKLVTDLDVSDFDKICKIGVIVKAQMDDAIYGFRRKEAPVLNYVGGNDKIHDEKWGGF